MICEADTSLDVDTSDPLLYICFLNADWSILLLEKYWWLSIEIIANICSLFSIATSFYQLAHIFPKVSIAFQSQIVTARIIWEMIYVCIYVWLSKVHADVIYVFMSYIHDLSANSVEKVKKKASKKILSCVDLCHTTVL